MVNYSEICDDAKLVKLANDIREAIHKVLPSGATAYKLLGLKTKKNVYEYGKLNVKEGTRPAETTKGKIYAVEDMSRAQIGFLGNLNNLSSLDNLKDITGYGVVKDPIDKDNWILILIEKKRDSLKRIIERKQGIIFRPYTQEEEEEYRARMDERAAAELGVGESPDEIQVITDVDGF